MSQYPSPYNPPPFPQNLGYAYPQGNLLSAARRAGTLMLFLGGLILLLGLVNTIRSISTPAQEMLQFQQKMTPSGDEFPLSAATYKAMAVVVAVATVTAGAVFIILALGVRRGGKASTIAAIVLTSFLLMMTALMTFVFLIGGMASPPILVLSCLPGGTFALFLWQLLWLIPALRNSGRLSTAAQQYQMQYWQYQQNMQAHSGYGYGAPPSTPPNIGENPPAST